MAHLNGQKIFFLMLIPSFMQTVYSTGKDLNRRQYNTTGTTSPLVQVACPEYDPDRHEQRGKITSPNYPNEYPPGSQCKWRIFYDPGEVVTISFQAFNVEQTDGAQCTSDKLQIQEKSIRTYCGYERPSPYISDPTSGSKDILIRFQSDEQIAGTGFSLEYYKSQQNMDSCPDAELEFLCQNHRCIPKEWLCNDMDECGDRSDEAVDVCQTVPSVSPVTGIPYCPPHTIYCLKMDGITSQCLPEDKKCDGNQDCYNNEDELGCQATCIHEMPPPSGSFSSPNYPGQYQNNLDCRWTLVVTEGNIIQLRFVAFDIEQGYLRDYVTVYDGGSISADIIGTYYGYKSSSPDTSTHYPSAVIEGSSNRLYVTFITDSSSGNTGFNATYQSKGDCIDDQRTCSATDSNCYAENERCDGKMTCLRGEDEQGCNGCPEGDIPCSTSSDLPLKCYNSLERCNGQPRCSGKEDELDCPASLCSGEHGLFLCGMGKCIKENWICDSNVDCPDNTDEMNCPMSPKVITAAVVGSIVCGLLLIAALSCTCKLYQLYHSDPHPPTHVSPLSEIEDELMRREAPPSYTASMSSPHFDEAQRAFIESLQAAAQARAGEGNNRTSRTSRRRNNSQPEGGVAPQPNTNRPSSPDSINTTQDTISTTDSTTVSPPNQQNPPSSDVADDGSSPYTEITELRERPNLGGDTASSCTTDTDSDTNAEAELEHRDHDIIRAATNIRRMRLAGGLQNIVDSVTNRQREGAADGETRRRSSSGLQNIIQRVNRTRENQQRGEGENSGANSPTSVTPPTPAGPDGTCTPPNTQESSFTSEDDHSPERDNAVNHHSTSSTNGSVAVVQGTAERNESSGASDHKPISNSPQPPPSPSPSSRSDDAPIDLSNSHALDHDEDSTIIDDDETMLLASS